MADPGRYELPPHCQLIEVHVTHLKQLFHSLDPTPFRERDLDPKAEEFIASWARDLDPDKPIALVVHVDEAPPAAEMQTLHDAVRDYFAERMAATRRRLRQLFRIGRTSLVIGLIFLAASILTGDLLASVLEDTRFADVARESLLIGGWVAMWKPIEIFLYDWWPIRAEAKLMGRLSAMVVRVVPSSEASPPAAAPPR
ncbi:MAG TPA: hypothetical protein VFZ31_03985 [Vicinamibacterales bacterium]